MTKITTWWFLGTALKAMFSSAKNNTSDFSGLLLENLKLGAFVESMEESFTFPLPIELVFVPSILLLIGMFTVADMREESKPASKLLKNFISIIGLGVLIFVLRQSLVHNDEIISMTKFKEFFLPLILMTAFIPFLYAWRYVMVMQTALHMTKFALRDDPKLFAFARFRILKAVGFSLQRAELFESRFRQRFWGLTLESEILAVVRDFGAASQR